MQQGLGLRRRKERRVSRDKPLKRPLEKAAAFGYKYTATCTTSVFIQTSICPVTDGLALFVKYNKFVKYYFRSTD